MSGYTREQVEAMAYKLDQLADRVWSEDGAGEMLRALQSEVEALRDRAGECKWTQSGGYEFDTWKSDCGREWCFSEGGDPVEHGCKFCHSCGKVLKMYRSET